MVVYFEFLSLLIFLGRKEASCSQQILWGLKLYNVYIVVAIAIGCWETHLLFQELRGLAVDKDLSFCRYCNKGLSAVMNDFYVPFFWIVIASILNVPSYNEFLLFAGWGLFLAFYWFWECQRPLLLFQGLVINLLWH